MSTSLPQPATVSVDRRKPGLLYGIKHRWVRFKQGRNTGSSPSNFEKDFPFGGGSTEASTSVTGAPDEPQRKRDVYYAIPKGMPSRDGEEHTSRFRTARRRASRPQGKPSEPVEADAEEIVDVDVVVVDNSFEVGGQQESLTEPSAGPNATEHQPTVAMQPGQGKINGGYGWDPKDKQNGLNLSSSQYVRSRFIWILLRTLITELTLSMILDQWLILESLPCIFRPFSVSSDTDSPSCTESFFHISTMCNMRNNFIRKSGTSER